MVLFCSINFLTSCKKINEATEIGGDLIPAVDNVNTFDTTISVETYNGLFTDLTDSTRSTISDQQFLGAINNNPLFGKTEASLFFELKPATYPYSFPFRKDSTRTLDSVVLVLGVSSMYGDTNAAQQVRVFEIDASNTFRSDSSYLIRKNLSTGLSLGPARTFIPRTLKDTFSPKNERAFNQLRIKLDNSFGQRLFNYDSTNAYFSDSAFKERFKGFAVIPQSSATANALIGINLSDTNTKLAFYYKYNNGRVIDTVTYFRPTSRSATANYIKRDYAGSQLATYQGGTTPDDLVFIQNTPGSYATIALPALSTINNRVVHRAELIMEQVYDARDVLFTPPDYLYLDAAVDTAKNKYRTIPFDLAFTPFSQIGYYQITNPDVFGMRAKKTADITNKPIYIWKFNLTRYVQHVLNKTEPLQNLRLYSPYIIKNTLAGSSIEGFLFGNTSYAIGQVRLAGGSNDVNKPQRMRLRIIYSKI
jgi:hypothetical protein